MTENIAVMPSNTTEGNFLNNDKRAFRAILWNIISPVATIILGILLIVTGLFLGFSSFGSNNNNSSIALFILLAVFILMILGLAITSTVFYLQWVYRAHLNAETIAKEKLFLSAGWHVGFHFIPLANVIVPYLLMLRIAEKSSSKESRTMVLIWWISIIISIVFSFGSIFFTLAWLPALITSGDTAIASSGSGVESIFSGLGNLASFIGFIVSFLVINTITKGQKERADELGLLKAEDKLES